MCGARRAFASIVGEPGAAKCFACGGFIPPGISNNTTSPWLSVPQVPRVRLSAVNPACRDEMLASLHRAWLDERSSSEHPFLQIMRTLTSPHHIRRSPIGLGRADDRSSGSILFWYISQDKTVWNAKRIMYVGRVVPNGTVARVCRVVALPGESPPPNIPRIYSVKSSCRSYRLRLFWRPALFPGCGGRLLVLLAIRASVRRASGSWGGARYAPRSLWNECFLCCGRVSFR